MNIDFIEIGNFRRLAAVHIDFSKKTTLFVGANNSGKTSAMTAFRYFLVKHKQNLFSVHDRPVTFCDKINKWGDTIEKDNAKSQPLSWKGVLPFLDVWLNISENEIHHVAHLIPTLDWQPKEGIGIRFQLEPKDVEELQKAYRKEKNRRLPP